MNNRFELDKPSDNDIYRRLIDISNTIYYKSSLPITKTIELYELLQNFIKELKYVCQYYGLKFNDHLFQKYNFTNDVLLKCLFHHDYDITAKTLELLNFLIGNGYIKDSYSFIVTYNLVDKFKSFKDTKNLYLIKEVINCCVELLCERRECMDEIFKILPLDLVLEQLLHMNNSHEESNINFQLKYSLLTYLYKLIRIQTLLTEDEYLFLINIFKLSLSNQDIFPYFFIEKVGFEFYFWSFYFILERSRQLLSDDEISSLFSMTRKLLCGKATINNKKKISSALAIITSIIDTRAIDILDSQQDIGDKLSEIIIYYIDDKVIVYNICQTRKKIFHIKYDSCSDISIVVEFVKMHTKLFYTNSKTSYVKFILIDFICYYTKILLEHSDENFDIIDFLVKDVQFLTVFSEEIESFAIIESNIVYIELLVLFAQKCQRQNRFEKIAELFRSAADSLSKSRGESDKYDSLLDQYVDIIK